MFIDASAIVAILTREPEADALAVRLEGTDGCMTSPIAVFEAALAICRKRRASVTEARDDVREFLGIARINLLGIGDAALEAFERSGKGRNHPTQLNPNAPNGIQRSLVGKDTPGHSNRITAEWDCIFRKLSASGDGRVKPGHDDEGAAMTMGSRVRPDRVRLADTVTDLAARRG